MNIDKALPYIVIAIIRIIYVGQFFISKAAFHAGMNSFIFVFYRQAFATIFLAPFAVHFERKTAPHLSMLTFCKIFMLSLIGVTGTLEVHNVALNYTSAILAAASFNTVPAITFFLAVLLRMETINWRTVSTASKIFGVMACLAGVATIAFYKGPRLQPLVHHPLFGHGKWEEQVDTHSTKTWIKGSFLMLAANFLWSFWVVFQGKVLQNYPSKLLFSTMQNFISTIQAFVVAIAVQRNAHSWKLHFDVGLLAILYGGIMVTGVSFYLQTWCIAKKGPVFLTMSTPLGFILTMLCSVLLFGESISMGSVLGGLFLVAGLYSVLWGKIKEENEGKLASEGKENKEIRMIVSEDENKKAASGLVVRSI